MRFRFQNYLNILLPNYLKIHHIDLCKRNNKLNNLIILDKNLHSVLHKDIKDDSGLKERWYLSRYLKNKKIKKYPLIVSKILDCHKKKAAGGNK